MTAPLSVIIAGMLWLTSASVLLEVSRILGPTYHTKRTVHWIWRCFAWVGAAIFFVRGMTLLFPGDLIEPSRVSAVAPWSASAVLGVCLALLDLIMRERSPPPWSVTALRLVSLLGLSGPVKVAAMSLPAAAVGDLPPAEEPRRARMSRLPVLIGAVLVIVVIAVFLAFNAPVARG